MPNSKQNKCRDTEMLHNSIINTYWLERKGTRNVHNDAFAFLKMRNGQLCDEHYRAEIKFDHVLQCVHQLWIVDATKSTSTGIVHQYI